MYGDLAESTEFAVETFQVAEVAFQHGWRSLEVARFNFDFLLVIQLVVLYL